MNVKILPFAATLAAALLLTACSGGGVKTDATGNSTAASDQPPAVRPLGTFADAEAATATAKTDCEETKFLGMYSYTPKDPKKGAMQIVPNPCVTDELSPPGKAEASQ